MGGGEELRHAEITGVGRGEEVVLACVEEGQQRKEISSCVRNEKSKWRRRSLRLVISPGIGESQRTIRVGVQVGVEDMAWFAVRSDYEL